MAQEFERVRGREDSNECRSKVSNQISPTSIVFGQSISTKAMRNSVLSGADTLRCWCRVFEGSTILKLLINSPLNNFRYNGESIGGFPRATSLRYSISKTR